MGPHLPPSHLPNSEALHLKVCSVRPDLLWHKKPVSTSIPSLPGQMRGDGKPVLPSFPLQGQLVPFRNKSVRGNLENPWLKVFDSEGK